MKSRIYGRNVKLSFKSFVSALLAVILLAASGSMRSTSAGSGIQSASGRLHEARSIPGARANRRPSPRAMIFSEDPLSDLQLQERLLDTERMTRSQEIARERSPMFDRSRSSESMSNQEHSAGAQSSQSNVRLTIRDIGPETGVSGSGSGFVFNRDSRQVILPTPQRVFRSLNGGSNWSPLDLAVSTVPWATPQTAGSYFVRQDPRNPEVLYAVTAGLGNLARSTDFGATWTQLRVDDSFAGSWNFADIAVHEVLPNVVLALRITGDETFGPALWRSEDGGATFTPQWNTGLPQTIYDEDTGEACTAEYSNIATTPADPNVVYVVQSHGSEILEGNFRCPAGVHKSTDGGLTFALLEATSDVVEETPGRTYGWPIQVFPHPTRPEVLFVQTDYPFNSSIYRSIDGGASFQPVGGGLPNQNFFVSFDRNNPSLVYVAGVGGVFRSQDDGETFLPLGLTVEQLGPFATNVSVDPSDSKVIYVNTWNGNFKSTNGGVTFHAINNGWRAAFIRTIAFDNGANSTLYLATDHGIIRTSTRGQQYERVRGPNALNNTRLLTIAPSNADVIFAVTGRALYRTLDGGQSWTESSFDISSVLPDAIVVDPQDSNNVYLVGEPGPNGGFYRSVDAGATFERIDSTADFRALAIDPQHSNVIFAGVACINGCRPLLKSVDGGLSFAPTSSLTDQFQVAFTSQVLIDPQNPNNIFLQGVFSYSDSYRSYAVVRSTDGGATWSPPGTGFQPGCTALLMNPENPARLYCRTESPAGLSMSSDSGNTWSIVSADEIAKLGIAELLINPKQPNLLYLLGSALLEVEIHKE